MNATNIAALIVSISSALVGLVSITFVKAISTIALCASSLGIPILYIMLVKSVRKTQKDANCQTVAHQHKRNNIRMARNVQWLIGCHFISHMPILMVAVASIVTQNNQPMYYSSRIAMAIMSLNSCFNPILYILKNKTHQRVLRTVFGWKSNTIGMPTNNTTKNKDGEEKITIVSMSTIRKTRRIRPLENSTTLKSISNYDE